jgi:signal transduction histidine kinase
VHIGTLATFAAAAGVAMRAGWMLNRELGRLTEVLLRTRHERVRLAVVEERTRVAREMHDLVAHSVTAMVVQAGAARMVAETDPALAEENLEQIEETGVDAMRELGILNATLDPASTILERDRPGDASDVRVLVDRFRRTGQTVHLVEEGERPPVDQGLQISVYRIVQEALTNVQKHARGAPTTVSIRYQPGGIEIEVANSAVPTIQAGDLPGAGQGLIGIHERASVFGGWAEAGQTPAGGFRVYAHLPAELVPA